MPNKRLMLIVAALISMTLLTACYTRYYDLKMRADGATLYRELSLSNRQDRGDSIREEWQQERLRIAAVYGMDVPLEEEKRDVFSGSFEKRTPNDLGGSGYFLHCDSPLGSASAYSEQIRGQDDIATYLQESHAALDARVDVGLQWLESEFGETEGYAALHKLVDEDIRHDVWNIHLYMWSFSGIGPTLGLPGQSGFDEHVEELLWIRLAHYLAARDYFDPLQIPQLSRAMDEWVEEEEPQSFVTFGVRGLASKMGVEPGAPLPPALDAIRVDFEKHLDSADDFFDAAEMDGRIPEDAASWDLEIFEVGKDILRAELELPAEPFIHNGEWTETGVLKWQQDYAAPGEYETSLPNILYAFWAEKDVDQQVKHFGEVVLDGEELAYYCVWRQGLSEARREDWDEFVASLQPGPGLVDALKSFSFDDEPEYLRPTDYTGARSDVADNVIDGIVNFLAPPPEEDSDAIQ